MELQVSYRDCAYHSKPLYLWGFSYVFCWFVASLSQTFFDFLKNTAPYSEAVFSRSLHKEFDILAVCSSNICT